MQSSSLPLSCPRPLPPPPPPPLLLSHLTTRLRPPAFSALPWRRRAPLSGFSFSHRWHPSALPIPACSGAEIGALAEPVAVEEIRELDKGEPEFVEVGYICNAHGLKGELKVKPSTGFPEFRFCEPGRRWLKARVMGKDTIREVELTGGRNHPGQKIWIISISGIDTVEKAKQTVGSAILVREDDRPTLEDGEFYTPDLVGMRVVLKENGMPIGTVVNVVNYGSNDLLRVMLDSTEKSLNTSAPLESISASGSLVWVPFVEAIVPDIDLNRRVMQITPPKGLLELNLRSDSRSKKERSQLEWKHRKKFQQRVIAAKKKLCSMGQKHVLKGFSFGEKDKRSMLADQIVDINFKLFQHTVKSIDLHSSRYNLSKFMDIDSININTLRVSQTRLSTTSINDKETYSDLLKNGLDLFSNCKVGIVMVVSDDSNQVLGPSEKPVAQLLLLQQLLDGKLFTKVDGQRISVPLVIVSPANEVQYYQEFFSDHDYLGFDVEKVWFLEEAKLPVLNISSTDEGTHRILLKSPWEILQSPVGSGGVLNLLSSHKIIDDLNKWGVEYVQVCCLTERTVIGDAMFFGLTSSKGMDMGIKLFDGAVKEDEFDVILSTKYLNEINKQVEKLQFSARPMLVEHVELVDDAWNCNHPTAPNSVSLRSSIYSLLDTTNLDNICVLQITD